MTRDFLEVDDLSPAELATVLDVAAAGKARPDEIPHVLADHGVALVVREAVGPDPVVERDGRRGARWAPHLPAGRGGRHRHPGDRRGRRAHPGRVLQHHRGAGVRARGARADRGRRRRAGGEPALGPCAPVPGPRRPADPAGALRGRRGSAARVRGRRQQRRRVARLRRRAHRARAHGVVTRGVRARRRHRGPGPEPRRNDRPDRRSARGGQGGRRGLHRRLDLDGGRARGRGAPRGVLHLAGRRRARWRWPAPARTSCTACPRIGARR